MELFKLLLDKAFSWPMVAFVAILAFWKPIAAVLHRGDFEVGIGAKGLTVASKAKALAMQVDAKLVAGSLGVIDEARREIVRNVPISSVVSDQMGRIREDLKRTGIGEDEKVELLIRHLATSQLLAT